MPRNFSPCLIVMYQQLPPPDLTVKLSFNSVVVIRKAFLSLWINVNFCGLHLIFFLRLRPVLNVVRLPYRTKLIELNSTLARQ